MREVGGGSDTVMTGQAATLHMQTNRECAAAHSPPSAALQFLTGANTYTHTQTHTHTHHVAGRAFVSILTYTHTVPHTHTHAPPPTWNPSSSRYMADTDTVRVMNDMR